MSENSTPNINSPNRFLKETHSKNRNTLKKEEFDIIVQEMNQKMEEIQNGSGGHAEVLGEIESKIQNLIGRMDLSESDSIDNYKSTMNDLIEDIKTVFQDHVDAVEERFGKEEDRILYEINRRRSWETAIGYVNAAIQKHRTKLYDPMVGIPKKLPGDLHGAVEQRAMVLRSDSYRDPIVFEKLLTKENVGTSYPFFRFKSLPAKWRVDNVKNNFIGSFICKISVITETHVSSTIISSGPVFDISMIELDKKRWRNPNDSPGYDIDKYGALAFVEYCIGKGYNLRCLYNPATDEVIMTLDIPEDSRLSRIKFVVEPILVSNWSIVHEDEVRHQRWFSDIGGFKADGTGPSDVFGLYYVPKADSGEVLTPVPHIMSPTFEHDHLPNMDAVRLKWKDNSGEGHSVGYEADVKNLIDKMLVDFDEDVYYRSNGFIISNDVKYPVDGFQIREDDGVRKIFFFLDKTFREGKHIDGIGPLHISKIGLPFPPGLSYNNKSLRSPLLYLDKVDGEDVPNPIKTDDEKRIEIHKKVPPIATLFCLNTTVYASYISGDEDREGKIRVHDPITVANLDFSPIKIQYYFTGNRINFLCVSEDNVVYRFREGIGLDIVFQDPEPETPGYLDLFGANWGGIFSSAAYQRIYIFDDGRKTAILRGYRNSEVINISNERDIQLSELDLQDPVLRNVIIPPYTSGELRDSILKPLSTSWIGVDRGVEEYHNNIKDFIFAEYTSRDNIVLHGYNKQESFTIGDLQNSIGNGLSYTPYGTIGIIGNNSIDINPLGYTGIWYRTYNRNDIEAGRPNTDLLTERIYFDRDDWIKDNKSDQSMIRVSYNGNSIPVRRLNEFIRSNNGRSNEFGDDYRPIGRDNSKIGINQEAVRYMRPYIGFVPYIKSTQAGLPAVVWGESKNYTFEESFIDINKPVGYVRSIDYHYGNGFDEDNSETWVSKNDHTVNLDEGSDDSFTTLTILPSVEFMKSKHRTMRPQVIDIMVFK